MDSTRSGDPVEGHTLRVVDQALADLRLRTLTLGRLVIDQVSVAINSLLRADQSLADKVLARTPQLDELSREIDHRAFETTALRPLVAGDLRLARAISRIAVDLLRAGDERTKIARIGVRLPAVPSPEPLVAVATSLRHMASVAGAMLRNALRGLDQAATELAEAVIAQDRDLHGDFSGTLRLLLTCVTAGTPRVGAIIDAVFAAKCLERIGDHAKNMAEQVG